MKLIIGETVLTAALADNSSAEVLEEKLKDSPITIQMEDYARMEKVGTFPSACRQMTSPPPQRPGT